MAKDFRGEIIYNPEDDLHYATLTVRYTLGVALQTRTPGKESRMEGESRKDYVKEFLRVATKLLWIEHTLDTKVGNEYIRGVSGGERKRVSIAEALITRASVQGWDNSSKGLDASTAVEYVQSLRALTNMAHISTAVSLCQAGESLYNIVDKVLLIDNGKCLYYGTADRAKQYFLDLGLECPDRWTTADFLTSVTDPFERSVKPGWKNRIPRSAQDFADVYMRSEAYQRNLDDVRVYEAQLERQRRERSQNTPKKTKKKNFTIPFHQQVMALTRRQFLVTLGDKASLFGKWGGIIFQGLVVESLLYNLPENTAGAFTRGGVLFFILLFNALLALAELTAGFESKPILLKHKNFSFYRPSAYALAQTAVDIPLVLVQVVLFAVIIYWMAGVSATPSQFFISILVLWLVTMTTYAFFRAISAVFKTLDSATKVPKTVQDSIETGGRKGTVSDEETGRVNEKVAAPEQSGKGQKQKDKEVLGNVAKNETIFTFQDVNYAIPFQDGERKLLQNVQGYVRPGKLTALMGASGSGKTTLLNTLAQRELLASQSSLTSMSQVPATVREALQFSALLRQPKEVVKEEKYAYCETIIDLLEMQDIAGATISKVGESLNPEQRKRLTIGVELASKPELLMFLDEHPSGLDSGAAFNIARFLRKLADAGQAILCTIHQPSAVLFENFDELILLESGGCVVYAGDLGKGSQKMMSYFKENGGPKCPPDVNPAEWALDTIGAGNPDYKSQDWGDTWLQSRKYEEQSRDIGGIVEKRKNADHSRNVRDDREYAMPLWTQTTAVVKRSFVTYWRTPNYIMGKFILHIFTGLFNCFTFYKLGYATIDVQSRLFSIFMALTISPPLIQQLQPVFLHSRDIFQSRENNAKICSWFAWTTAAVLVEIPRSHTP
ncbi:hypothetical protein DL765_002722 [Monosporascus sp. GIB2]|nr:hypothetical protein DL765_002722 [Monosporascus sp. GIB2]